MNALKRIAKPLFMILSAFIAIALCGYAEASERIVTHIVRPGETLQVISDHYYGTTRRWTQIYEANRSVLKTPQTVAPGMKLKLRVDRNSKLANRALKANKARSPAQVQVESLNSSDTPGRVTAPAGGIPQTHGLLPPKSYDAAAVAVSPEEPTEAPASVPVPSMVSSPVASEPTVVEPAAERVAQPSRISKPVPSHEALIEVRVRDGDTLESLAERHMGSAKFWPRIIELNRKIIHDPEDLQPGMLISIENLLPRPQTASPVRAADQFSAIEVAAADSRPQAVEPPAAVSAPALPNRGLPHYDEFLDP